MGVAGFGEKPVSRKVATLAPSRALGDEARLPSPAPLGAGPFSRLQCP